MDRRQRELVIEYRKAGKTATWISRELAVSVNTIKSYCRRHGLTEKELRGKYRCEQCGAPVYQEPGRKKKRFCSDKCRTAWWNEAYRKGTVVRNKEEQTMEKKLAKKPSSRVQTCIYCGKNFEVPSGAVRKYCSHQCYINDRFGEKTEEEKTRIAINTPEEKIQEKKQSATTPLAISMSSVTQEERDELEKNRFNYNIAIQVFLDAVYKTAFDQDPFQWYCVEEIFAKKYNFDENSIFRIDGPPDVRDDYKKCAELKKEYKRKKNKLIKERIKKEFPEKSTLMKMIDDE